MRISHIRQLVLFAVLASALSGCDGTEVETVTLTHYPQFWTDDLRGTHLYVAAFANGTVLDWAGVEYERSTLAHLGSSYRVVDRGDWMHLPLNEYVSRVGMNDPGAFVLYGEITSAQADRVERSEIRREPVYEADAWGEIVYDIWGDPVVAYYEDVLYNWYDYDCMVTGNVMLYDAAAGREIERVDLREMASGSFDVATPPDEQSALMYNICMNAVSQLGAGAGYAVAPTDVRFSYSRGTLLDTSSAPDVAQNHSEVFTPQGIVHAIVTLPELADYNEFIVDIATNAGESITGRQFRWDKNDRQMIISFPVSSFILPDQGEYKVRLWSVQGGLLEVRQIRIDMSGLGF